MEIKWYNLKSIEIINDYINTLLNKQYKNKTKKTNYLSFENNSNSNYNTKSKDPTNTSFNKNNNNDQQAILISDLKRYSNIIKSRKILMNLIIMTFLSRYIDIITKVKYGGLIYFSLVFSSLYLSNKYYNRYFLYQKLEMIRKYNDISGVSILIEQIIQLHLSKNKNEMFNEKELSKYWNEPMAWH